MKKNKVLLWGASPSLPKGEPFSLTYKRSGNNFGNTLIGNGIVSVLSGYRWIFRSELSCPEEADERCCHIVIPAANFLWKGFDFGYMADFIEKTSLPVTIIGLGAQTNNRSEVSSLHPNTLRLIKVISDRSPSLGVRGFYTAEVLAAHGILNVEVLGCPSLYTNLSPLPVIKNNKADMIDNMAINFSRRVSRHSFCPSTLQKIENAIFKLALLKNLTFIAQDELEELSLADGQNATLDCKSISNYFNESDSDDVFNFFKKNTQYYCEVDDWAAYIRSRTGCIGSRLHGNIIALINGIPSLTVVHDSRTLEMCALTGAPYLHIGEYSNKDITYENIIEHYEAADYSLFERNMKTLFVRYKNFLDKNNLSNIL